MPVYLHPPPVVTCTDTLLVGNENSTPPPVFRNQNNTSSPPTYSPAYDPATAVRLFNFLIFKILWLTLTCVIVLCYSCIIVANNARIQFMPLVFNFCSNIAVTRACAKLHGNYLI